MALLGVFALIGLLILPVVLAVRALRTGVFSDRSGTYSRENDPFGYWYCVGIMVYLIGLVVWLAATFILY